RADGSARWRASRALPCSVRLVIDPAFFGIVSESFFSLRFMIAAATHRNGVATITTTFGDGRMSRSVFRRRDSNLGQCFRRFAASAGCFNRGKSEAGSTCFGHIAEWHVVHLQVVGPG